MTPDGQQQIGSGDPRTVVDDLDRVRAAAFDRNDDPPRAGVDRILDELLDDRSGPLDDLTGSDLSDGHCIQFADGVIGRHRALWLQE